VRRPTLATPGFDALLSNAATPRLVEVHSVELDGHASDAWSIGSLSTVSIELNDDQDAFNLNGSGVVLTVYLSKNTIFGGTIEPLQKGLCRCDAYTRRSHRPE